jgi:hypothetical protein
VLAVFALAFAAQAVGSFVQKSATWDEFSHLTAGYAALRDGDYRFSPGHLPFQRMWDALPLLLMDKVAWDAGDASAASTPERWAQLQFDLPFRFLYKLNDADALLYRARAMTVLLGIALGLLVYFWARELFGFRPAVLALALYAVEPNILAHAGLVTTDFAVTCFVFGAVSFLWRLARRGTAGNLAGLTACFVLAQVSKFSAVLLWPVVLALLAARSLRPEAWAWGVIRAGRLTRRASRLAVAAAILCWLALASWAGVWAAYGFRYAPAPGRAELLDFTAGSPAQRAPRLAGAVRWIEDHRLLPNAYVQSAFHGAVDIQERPAYLAGKTSATGWWYYFPVAFLVKTPVGLLLLLAWGIVLAGGARRRERWGDGAFLVLPVAIFLGAAMRSNVNIGLRHVLPIYPFVVVLAAWGVADLFRRRRGAWAAALVGLAILESAAVFPDYLAFFNAPAGGPSRGDRWLVDSNLDWGQDLKGLKRWMDRQGVKHVNLCYFGTADPAYYGIDCTYLPGSPFFARNLVQGPRLPGYVAVSVTRLRGVGLTEVGRAIYAPLLAMKPVAEIGHSIRVYWVER